MNDATHLMIDGSHLVVSADLDLSSPVSTFGWVYVEALGRAHPFQIQPPGYTYNLEKNVLPLLPSSIEVGPINEFSMKGGILRIVEGTVKQQKGVNQITVGAWEGETGCIWTSRTECAVAQMIGIFDSVDFMSSDDGVCFTSPIDPTLRAPRCIKEIPDFAVVTVTPLIDSEIKRLPGHRGARVNHGDLYRVRRGGASLMLVTASALAIVDPRDRSQFDEDALVDRTAEMEISWNSPA